MLISTFQKCLTFIMTFQALYIFLLLLFFLYCTEYSAECAVGSLKEMFIHPYQNMLQVFAIACN